MNLPLNTLAMFVATCACGVLAYFVWTAGSSYFDFPALLQDAVAWLCVGGAFVFLAMTVAAFYDDMLSQEDGE